MNLIVFLELNSSRSGGASLSQTLPEALRREGSGGLKVDLPVDVVDTALARLAGLRDPSSSKINQGIGLHSPHRFIILIEMQLRNKLSYIVRWHSRKGPSFIAPSSRPVAWFRGR